PFHTSTTTGAPGSGPLRLNAATENTATAAYVNLLDTGGTDWTAVLDTFDASSSTVKGQVRWVNEIGRASCRGRGVIWGVGHSGKNKLAITTTSRSRANAYAHEDAWRLEVDRTSAQRSNRT